MTSTIKYSLFHQYDYEGKSFAMKALDELSTPVRKLFNGRRIDVINQTATDPRSGKAKAIQVIASAIFFPIGVPIHLIATAALVIKCATLPWFWHKKIVEQKSEEAKNKIQAQLDRLSAVQKNVRMLSQTDPEEASLIISTLSENRDLIPNPELLKKLVNALQTRINHGLQPYELENFLPYFHPADGLFLTQAITSREIANIPHDSPDKPSLNDPKALFNLFTKIPFKDLEAKKAAYKELSENILKIPGDPIFSAGYKVALIVMLAKWLIQLEKHEKPGSAWIIDQTSPTLLKPKGVYGTPLFDLYDSSLVDDTLEKTIKGIVDANNLFLRDPRLNETQVKKLNDALDANHSVTVLEILNETLQLLNHHQHLLSKYERSAFDNRVQLLHELIAYYKAPDLANASSLNSLIEKMKKEEKPLFKDGFMGGLKALEAVRINSVLQRVLFVGICVSAKISENLMKGAA